MRSNVGWAHNTLGLEFGRSTLQTTTIGYNPQKYFVDGGSHIEGPDYKFHDAYYSILDSEGNLIHFEKIGDKTNNIAEFRAIEWVVENIKERPLTISSDSQTAITWCRRGGTSVNGEIAPLRLEGIILEHQSHNVADQFNDEMGIDL